MMRWQGFLILTTQRDPAGRPAWFRIVTTQCLPWALRLGPWASALARYHPRAIIITFFKLLFL